MIQHLFLMQNIWRRNIVLNRRIWTYDVSFVYNHNRISIDVLDADINFMKTIDITTLFGNLIDNAITACKDVRENRHIGIHIKEFKEMLSIRIENSIAVPVPISGGKIEMERKGKKGIGLLNVQRCIDKYEGRLIHFLGKSCTS